MKQKSTIQSILHDIYTIDPELRAHEDAVVRVVTMLLEHKPDTHFDEAFARDLRQRLLTEHRNDFESQRQEPISFMLFIHTHMNKFIFGAAGVAIMAILAVGAVALMNDRGILPQTRLSFSNGQEQNRPEY